MRSAITHGRWLHARTQNEVTALNEQFLCICWKLAESSHYTAQPQYNYNWTVRHSLNTFIKKNKQTIQSTGFHFLFGFWFFFFSVIHRLFFQTKRKQLFQTRPPDPLYFISSVEWHSFAKSSMFLPPQSYSRNK